MKREEKGGSESISLPTCFGALGVADGAEIVGDFDPVAFLGLVLGDDGHEQIAILFWSPA